MEVSCDYYLVMRSVGIREFKTHLSRYLRAVEAGEILLITDHGRVVAEVRRSQGEPLAESEQERIARLAARGRIRLPVRSGKVDLGIPAAGFDQYAPPGTARDLLAWQRGDAVDWPDAGNPDGLPGE